MLTIQYVCLTQRLEDFRCRLRVVGGPAKRKKELSTLLLWTRHSQKVSRSVHTPRGAARKTPFCAKLSGVRAPSQSE